jgi:hypothetical protein
VDEKSEEEEKRNKISFVQKRVVCSFHSFFGYEFLLCDYANIIINKMIASQIRKHQELSQLNNKATINGIHISTNNKAHTIARNIT